MKKLLLPLCLTSSLVFAQDTVTTPINPEEAVAAPALEETPVTPLAPVAEAAPVVEEEKVEEEEKKEESKTTDLRVSSPMATFGVRGLAPENKSVEETVDPDLFVSRKSHWIGTFGFETTKYVMPMNFNGATISFDEEKRELFGGRLGFGREFYLGWGFLLQARLEGYYMGTLFESAKTADPNFPGTEVSSEKDTGQMYGGNAVAHFGWMFDYKTKNIFLGDMVNMACELFVEAGAGRGKSYSRKEYLFNASKVDFYDFIMEDEFTSRTATAGINFLSTTTGAFLTLKVSQMDLDVDKRRIRSKSLENAASGTSTSIGYTKLTVNKPDIDTMTVFALSGGVKF